MTDVTQQLSEFRSDVPLPDDDTTTRAYARATAQRPARPRRKRLVPVAAAFVLVFAAAAVAAVKETPWWQGGEPAIDPQAVALVARDNMPARVRIADARTVAHDGDAALVAAPLGDTGYCVIPAIDAHANLGASCIYQVQGNQSGDSDLLRSATQPNGHWIVYGRVTDARAAKIDLGAMSVDLARGGFFVADIPQSEWGKLARTASPARILSSSGAVLSTGCANWGDPPAATAHDEAAFWVAPENGKCVPQSVPERPSLDLAHAATLFDVTLTQPYSIWKPGETITFEAVPESDGQTCAMATGPRLPQAIPGCAGATIPKDGPPLSVTMGASLSHDGAKAFYGWDIQGTTSPGSHIAKVEISSPDATVPAKLGGNFFFAQLPVTTPGPVAGAVPFPDGPWTAVGYDAAGTVVARVDLNALYRQSTPH